VPVNESGLPTVPAEKVLNKFGWPMYKQNRSFKFSLMKMQNLSP